MICPACGSEYRAGVLRCADCDVELRERPAAPAAPAGGDPDELVPVLRTTDPALLPVLVSVLEAAGLEHVVQGSAGVSVFPLGPAAARATGRVTGAAILVRRRDLDEARALLDR